MSTFMDTPDVKVNITWLTNTNSRNAFYQVFALEPIKSGFDAASPAASACVTHYGSLAGPAGRIVTVKPFMRPVNYGTVQVHRNNVAGTKIAAKLRGDYESTDATSTTIAGRDFPKWLVETFGKSMAFELEQAMFHRSTDSTPSDAVENTSIGKATPEPQPESWATW